MEIYTNARKSRSGEDLLVEKAAQVLAQLEVEQDPRARALAKILQAHTPLSFLRAATVPQAAAWVREILRFIESPRQQVAVGHLPLAAPGRSLLAANAPDAPFLLDSLQNFLLRKNIRHQVISHPILTVERRGGKVVEISEKEGRGPRESLILLELEGIAAGDGEEIVRGGEKILQKVLQVHRDSRALGKLLKELESREEMASSRDFWQWLQKGNFLPFSYRALAVRNEDRQGPTIQEEEGSHLGLPPDPQELTCSRERPLADFPPAFQARIARPGPLVVEEVDRQSPLHRAESLVYLGFREKQPQGWREHAFLGQFSQKSTGELTCNVAPLRRRIEAALAALNIPPGCHDYRKTVEIFNTFPKVELFFMTPGELVEVVRSFTLLYRHNAVRVVPSRSLAVHGLTLLILMPRDFYDEAMVPRFERYLRRFFLAPAAATRIIHISADFISLHVGLQPAKNGFRIDLEQLERGLTRIARPWGRRLQILFSRDFGEIDGARLWRKYLGSFSREYSTRVHPRFAVRDVRHIEQLLDAEQELFDLWGPFGRRDEFYRLQFYSLRESYLNELIPFLENLHLLVIEEVDFTIEVDQRRIFIKSFAIRGGEGAAPLSSLRRNLLDALAALRRGEVDNDYLHRLLLLTGLDWRQIDVFRGYRNYYFQLGSPHSKRRVAFALIHNPRAALLLFRYFEARFRPEERWVNLRQREEEALSPLRIELAEALEQVEEINEDRILRTLFNLIDSTIRTNFFFRWPRKDYFLSFKISALGIIEMPAPRPLFEIFVHAAGMEGIHLRGGRVARGGIRWSDRPDDFRTEVLGLMKTQMTKNAVIVPVGSKGGFVVKAPWTTREEGAALAREFYQVLIRGLLDLTDNRRGKELVRPPAVVAYDQDDPYLVVAADKGTAQFSDLANAISREYGFWLGDAFASGGSRGYDHKGLGITARGAWECVKRHFRELGKDIQSEPFTVVGIGDMSGDVFGNGMLLSRQIRLRGAFDHRHIFIDPDPDPELSFRERRRLFDLPRSSWDDYDRARMSAGGGIWPRNAKQIPLSAPVRQWLGLRQETIDGPGLIRLLLGAEVDLLWNGGIGTYCKAGNEKQEEAGDRANDAVRIDAGQLRAKVVGEGGNLGFTQKARIEYAMNGGRINTDAVDNSAGVDSSDHEVNLKILMQLLQEEGVVASCDERDHLLREVVDEVCAAVLADNYEQSLCLSLDRRRSAGDVEPYLGLADRLSNAGLLDRRGEFLPSSREVLARPGQELTRPELAVLMAYAKMQLYAALLESDLPDLPGLRAFLHDYFPRPIRQRFEGSLSRHPLAREIAATIITNTIINQAGCAFPADLAQRTGAPLARVVGAYLTFDRVLNAAEIRRQVFALDNRIAAERQYDILLALEDALAELCRWHVEHDAVAAPEAPNVDALREQVAAYQKTLGSILAEEDWRQCRQVAGELEAEGFAAPLAQTIASLPHLHDFLPIAELVARTGRDFHSVAQTWNEVRQILDLRQIERRMLEVQSGNTWDRMALQSLQRRFAAILSQLTLFVWQETEGNPDTFFSRHRPKLKFYRSLLVNLRSTTPGNYHPFTVLAGALEEISL
ncbi:MAG: NAD-glutamate dehydrogenase domain-containing protein [Desulfuromonadales bacterium]